jgi:hypothetical protein
MVSGTRWASAAADVRTMLAGLALVTSQAAPAADYAVLVQDQPAGHLRDSVSADGRRVSTEFSYRDNGRGPDVRETLTLDERGRPVSYLVEGRTNFGAVVDERFEWRPRCVVRGR